MVVPTIHLFGRWMPVFCPFGAIAESGGHFSEVGAEESRVKFKKLGDAEIDAYLKAVHVLDKAGAYAAQECGGMIIENIEGAFDNVMGLPCALAKNLLDTARRAMQDDPTFA
jgi:predicted house-cleaning NTP pyrophosphatase (Maf/HAM1 superfamily)